MKKAFICQGIDNKGFKIQKEIYAKNKEAAKIILLTQNITALKIHKKSELLFFSIINPIKPEEITDLCVELSTLISAGISLSAALSIMIESTSKISAIRLLKEIKKQIESGRSLSEALKTHPHYFDYFFCNLVHAGEYSGTLDVILKFITAYREKMQFLKRKIKKAFFYPCLVLLIALSVTSILLIFVIPQFAHFFENAGAELPLLTQIIIKISGTLRKYGSLLFLIPIISFMVIKKVTTYFKSWQYFFDRFWLQWPLLGTILRKTIFARFFQTLAMTLQAGLPLLEALQLTKNVLGNTLYINAIKYITQQIKNGQPLHAALQKTNLFSARAIQMICIGEESGQLDYMLQKLTEHFSKQVEDKVKNLTQLLEPTLMIFLSIVVGALVIAMYLPIFRLGSIL